MKKQVFPPGWDEERVRKVIEHYDNQTEDEELMEYEAAFNDPRMTMMSVPTELVPAIARLIDEHEGKRLGSKTSRPRGTKQPTKKRAKAAARRGR